MDRDEVAKRFHQLAAGDQRPDTARLRDIFDDVEVALKAKVPQTVVLAELKSLGLSMTMASFKSALQRIRKERKQKNTESEPALKNHLPSTHLNQTIEKKERDSALIRPAGISNSAWSELQVKHARSNKNQ